MNRSALKNYAPKARLDFIRAVTDRAAFFGLTPDRAEAMEETGDVVIIGGSLSGASTAILPRPFRRPEPPAMRRSLPEPR